MGSNYLKIIDGNLLDATEDYICHQCNCVTSNAEFLAADVFKKYPYADSYKKRVSKELFHSPGTIEIFGNGKDQRFVVNFYAQYYPSIPAYFNDTSQSRLEWFRKCLELLSKIPNIQNQTIAFPFKIGCGHAGGYWGNYIKLIGEFATKNQINVTIYKL